MLEEDKVLEAITVGCPRDECVASMIFACLKAIIKVIERQYGDQRDMVVNEELRVQTESARCHNMDAEEVIGMFSAYQERSPNATLCYLSSKLRARKNRTVEYLDNMGEAERTCVVEWAVSAARTGRQMNRMKQALM